MIYKGSIERFWSLVEIGDGCWEWTGNRLRSGYGRINSGEGTTKMVRAHRVAYELSFGEIPDGMLVCHTCDNRACVRPNHLFLGTCADNHADRNAKGRQARGEKVNTARLTARKVRRIRALYGLGVTSRPALARRFGVSWNTIRLITSGGSWTHLTEKAA